MSEHVGHNPVVSVVLPTFNGARYLAESMQSVIDQTFTDWELIIVDDCSTDQTPDIIEQFAKQDPRIRSIRHQTNRKLPAALNTGFAKARGEFLTWTSDDNRFRRNALQVLVDFLSSQTGVDIVYAGFTKIDSGGRELETVPPPPPQLLLDGDVVGACFMYRRIVHHRVGDYAENLFCVEDYDFWLRCSKCCRFGVVNEDLYEYRVHAASLTETQTQLIHERTLGIVERHLPDLKWADSGSRAQAHLRLARWAYHHGDMARTRKHLLSAFPVTAGEILTRDRYMVAAAFLGQGLARTILGAYLSIKKPGARGSN